MFDNETMPRSMQLINIKLQNYNANSVKWSIFFVPSNKLSSASWEFTSKYVCYERGVKKKGYHTSEELPHTGWWRYTGRSLVCRITNKWSGTWPSNIIIQFNRMCPAFMIACIASLLWRQCHNRDFLTWIMRRLWLNSLIRSSSDWITATFMPKNQE